MKNKILAALIAIMAFGQGAMAAENGWEISSSTSNGVTTFTITRTNTAVAETVKYRFVNLSAFAGQHYNVTKVNGANSNALTGEFTFAADDATSRTIQVTESAGSGAYSYYKDNTSRSYKLELTDAGGFYLTKSQRSFTSGTNVNSSNVYAEQSVTVASGPVTITHDGFDQGYHAVSMSTYFSNAAPQAYLVAAGAELRMVVTLDEAEKDDGYQHIQLLVNRTTSFDDSASEGNPGTPTYSHYLASFAHKPGSTLTTYASVCFPLTSATDNCSAVDPAWNFSPYNNTVGKLYTQKFKSGYRASDGKLIVAKKSELNGLSTVGIRFDASGDNADTWYAKNVTAKFTAVDETAPTVLAFSLAPGYHARGNTVYVSVAFNEIVKVTGTPKLTTNNNWSDLSYVAGTGTNVLTFSGTIGNSASGSLNVTGLSGTVEDLAGNDLVGSGVTESNLCSLDANYVYTVTYDLDGGSVATENPATYHYETATLTLNNPIKPGYSFDGWTGSNGSTPSTTVTIANHSHGNKTYTANWTPITYTLRLHHNDGTNNYTDLAMTYDQAKTIQSVSRTGFTFTGWSTSANGAVVYTDGQEVSNLTTTDGATIDLYAQWTINTYSIHFNANGGSGVMSNEQFTYGETKALTANAFTREGYTFAGWSTSANGDVVYTDGEEVSNLTATDGATIDLYAKWTAHTYTVHFDANGGSGNMDDEPFTYGEEKVLTSNAFTQEGYNFAGWSTSANGAVVYTDGQSVSNLTATNGATVTLYAKWAELSPVAYIDADGTEKSAMAIPITESQTEYGTPITGSIGWYVVSGEVSLSNLVLYNEENHLILADDARLTLNSSEQVVEVFRAGNITIYGQSNGTGQIIVTAGFSSTGISVSDIIINGGNVTTNGNYGIDASDIIINGGNVTANGNHGIRGHDITIKGGNVEAIGTGADPGIYASSNFSINGGSVKASGSDGICGRGITITDGNVDASSSGSRNGIYAMEQGVITINGGNVTATGGNSGDGIHAYRGIITINGGYVTATGGNSGRGIYAYFNGRITINGGIVEANGGTYGIQSQNIFLAGGTVRANGYNGTVRIQSGLNYTDGTTIYTGSLNDDQRTAIAGKTMTPYVAPSPDLTLVQGTKDGVTAYWGTFYDSGSGYTLPAGAAAYTMDADYHLYRLGTDGSVIPKGTAVVIIADKADVPLEILAEASAADNAPGGNILVGRDVATEIDGIYVLGINASGAVGFYPLSGIALPAHKAGYEPRGGGTESYNRKDEEDW